MPVEYTCKVCAYVTMIYARHGKCPSCGTGTIIPTTSYRYWLRHKDDKRPEPKKPVGPPKREGMLSEFSGKAHERIQIGWKPFDKLLGGGIALGRVVRVTGWPGIGKSRLMAQIASLTRAFYGGGEEDADQLRERFDAMELKNTADIPVCMSSSLERLLAAVARHKRKVNIIDSLQSIHIIDADKEDTLDFEDAMFSGTQKEAMRVTARLIHYARKNNVSFFLVSHVNKDGEAEGLMKVEHALDTTMLFSGIRSSIEREVYCEKSRTGAVGMRIPLWMTARGLIDVPEGDRMEHLLRLVDEGLIQPEMIGKTAEDTDEQKAAGEKTFEAFEKHADGPREKPTKSRRSARGHAP